MASRLPAGAMRCATQGLRASPPLPPHHTTTGDANLLPRYTTTGTQTLNLRPSGHEPSKMDVCCSSGNGRLSSPSGRHASGRHEAPGPARHKAPGPRRPSLGSCPARKGWKVFPGSPASKAARKGAGLYSCSTRWIASKTPDKSMSRTVASSMDASVDASISSNDSGRVIRCGQRCRNPPRSPVVDDDLQPSRERRNELRSDDSPDVPLRQGPRPHAAHCLRSLQRPLIRVAPGYIPILGDIGGHCPNIQGVSSHRGPPAAPSGEASAPLSIVTPSVASQRYMSKVSGLLRVLSLRLRST